MKKHNNVTLKRRSKSETYRFIYPSQTELRTGEELGTDLDSGFLCYLISHETK